MKEKPVAADISDASSDLGPRLRAIRLRQGVGLRELARRLDLSPSSISQIETGKMRPSVRTLYALASEFGVTVDEVLFNEAPRAADRGEPSVPGSTRAAPEPGLAVQRALERPAIALNSGVRWERLGFWADEDVEFLEATYAPGGASSPDDAFVRHNGHEFGHVLRGTLRVVVGFDEFILEPGDCSPTVGRWRGSAVGRRASTSASCRSSQTSRTARPSQPRCAAPVRRTSSTRRGRGGRARRRTATSTGA